MRVGRFRAGQFPLVVKEHPVGVRGDAALEHRLERIARVPDRAEREVGPSVPGVAIGQSLEKIRRAGDVEVLVPEVRLRVAGAWRCEARFAGVEKVDRGGTLVRRL